MNEEQRLRVDANKQRALQIIEERKRSGQSENSKSFEVISPRVTNSSISTHENNSDSANNPDLRPSHEVVSHNIFSNNSSVYIPSSSSNQSNISTQSVALYCEQIRSDKDNELCNNILSISDRIIYDNFNEKCCSSCQERLFPQYELISRGETMKQYLIPADSIQFMKSLTKSNPKNTMWKPMKLYLRKHAMLKAYERFGGELGLEQGD